MSSSTTDATLVDVTMPQMGVSVVEGTIVAWRVAVGDHVAADETLCDISTDKIETEVPSPSAGVIAERAFEDLDGPVVRVATPDVPIPFSPPLEQAVLPGIDRVREACRDLLAY